MIETFIVAEALFATASGASFGIPVLRVSPLSNAQYIQHVDLVGKVTALNAIEVSGPFCYRLDAPFKTVEIGDAPVHVVRGPTGEVLAGRVHELIPNIRAWLAHVSHATTRMAFADFIGESRVAREAAREAHRGMLADTSPAIVDRWFLDAIVLAHVHRGVLRAGQAVIDPDRLEQLASLCWVDIDRDELIVRVPAELSSELGLNLDDLVGPFSEALAKASVVGARSMAIESGLPRPRPLRHAVETQGLARTVSVVVFENENLFQALMTLRGPAGTPVPAQDSDNFLHHVGSTKIEPETVRNLFRDLPAGQPRSILLVVPPMTVDNRVLERLIETIAKLSQELGWREYEIHVAITSDGVEMSQQGQEHRVSAMPNVSGVLSLGNAWTPLLVWPGQLGVLERVAQCIAGWVDANLTGALQALRRTQPRPGKARILTATRLDPKESDLGKFDLALPLANPIWPSVRSAEAIVGRLDGRGGNLRLVQNANPDFRARRFERIARLWRGRQSSRAQFAIAALEPQGDQGHAAFVGYIADVLTGLGWEVERDEAFPGLLVNNSRNRSIRIDVKINALQVTMERRLHRIRHHGALITVVGETSTAKHLPLGILPFDRLHKIEEVARALEAPLIDTIPRRNFGLAVTGARLDPRSIVPPELARDWLERDPRIRRWLHPLLSGRDIVHFPQGQWVLDFDEFGPGEREELGELIAYAYRDGSVLSALPRLPPKLRQVIDSGPFLLTPSIARHRIFVRCEGLIVPSNNLIAIREPEPWLLALLSSRIHALWAEARSTDLRGQSRYSVRTFETFPLPPGLSWGQPTDRALSESLSDYGWELEDQRASWQFTEIEDERKENLHPRMSPALLKTISLDFEAPGRAQISKFRSLTRLYDYPPAWQEDLMYRIDDLVSQAYGLRSDASREIVLDRLMELAGEI